MGDKDPSPFGCMLYFSAIDTPSLTLPQDTFSTSYFDADPTNYDASHSLLTENETQSIADFFSNTDPFHADQHFPLTTNTDTKHSVDDFSNWNDFITPPTVHGVSTTIPDQAHLHNGFFNDHTYAQPPQQIDHYGNTHDDLQAASTLFQNSQSSYAANNRSHSYHALPSSSDRPPTANGASTTDQSGKPLIITPHGLINEQLAALLPNHHAEGTLDSEFAAQWVGTNAIEMYQHEIERPNLKRSYTFGTDDSFNNPAGFSGPQGTETTDQITRRLMRDMRHGGVPVPKTGPNGIPNSSGRTHQSISLPAEQSEEEQSEEASSEEEEDVKPSKKRRKSKPGKEGLQKCARNGKGRKASAADEGAKRKRASAAAQKLQRENLTEEQKRSNHILSEQKRRNLIKRGFDDLHDLVPEIRNGGLSKSSVLTEAANFLENLIVDNNKFRKLVGG
jgi:hypothetical protein